MSDITSFQGSNRFLSNFYPAPVKYEGHTYPSVEHAYQAAKTKNVNHRATIRNALAPSAAKRLGRMIPLRDGWERMKEEVMLDLLRKKFQDPELGSRLKATCGQLVEGNTWGDRYWGVCNGSGKNRLGVLLMIVREELQSA